MEAAATTEFVGGENGSILFRSGLDFGASPWCGVFVSPFRSDLASWLRAALRS